MKSDFYCPVCKEEKEFYNELPGDHAQCTDCGYSKTKGNTMNQTRKPEDIKKEINEVFAKCAAQLFLLSLETDRDGNPIETQDLLSQLRELAIEFKTRKIPIHEIIPS